MRLEVTENNLILSDNGIDLMLEESSVQLTLAEAGVQGVPGESGASYEQSFNESNLSVAGLLPVTHNLNSHPSGVAIFTASGESVVPDLIEVLTLNTVALHFQSFRPLSGTWRLSITA